MLIFWDEETGGYIDLFDWPEHAVVADEQQPPSTADLLLTDEPLAARHRWLESLGFELDDSMSAYTHSMTPCPVCSSEGHALFAVGARGIQSRTTSTKSPRETLLDPSRCGPRRQMPRTTRRPRRRKTSIHRPEGEPRWVRVGSIAELKLLPRFIGVRNKKPLTFTDRFNDPSQPLKASTFSHKEAEDSKCGGFEGGIDAEGFVREGGVCIDHVSTRRVWDAKERRSRQTTVTTPQIFVYGLAPPTRRGRPSWRGSPALTGFPTPAATWTPPPLSWSTWTIPRRVLTRPRLTGPGTC